MNEKISGFIINSVLTVLLVGILVLPIASVGLLGVEGTGDVLSVGSTQDNVEDSSFVREETTPAVRILNK